MHRCRGQIAMIRSTFFGLNTAMRGLLAQQTALDVTGHNIANVNTRGYSRQRVDMSATDPFSFPAMNAVMPGQMGTGVDVGAFQRLRDQYLDRNIRGEMAYKNGAHEDVGS